MGNGLRILATTTVMGFGATIAGLMLQSMSLTTAGMICMFTSVILGALALIWN
jgi:hypothetical protein